MNIIIIKFGTELKPTQNSCKSQLYNLNGSNYAQWVQAIEVFLLGRKKFDYVISEPSVPTDPKFANWRAEDAQIRSCLWNSMQSKISCSLVFLPTAKLPSNTKTSFDTSQKFGNGEVEVEENHNGLYREL